MFLSWVAKILNCLKSFNDIELKKRARSQFGFFFVFFYKLFIYPSCLQLDPHRSSVRGRGRSVAQPSKSGSVMGQSVLVVRAGKCPVNHLSQPIRLTFRHNLSEVTKQNLSDWQSNPQSALWSFTLPYTTLPMFSDGGGDLCFLAQFTYQEWDRWVEKKTRLPYTFFPHYLCFFSSSFLKKVFGVRKAVKQTRLQVKSFANATI